MNLKDFAIHCIKLAEAAYDRGDRAEAIRVLSLLIKETQSKVDDLERES